SLARFQGQHGVGGPGMGEEMVAIRVDRLREPAARFALVAFEPGYALLQRLVVGRHARLPQDVDDQSGRVTIAGSVAIVGTFVEANPVAKSRQTPAAVCFLQGPQLLD